MPGEIGELDEANNCQPLEVFVGALVDVVPPASLPAASADLDVVETVSTPQVTLSVVAADGATIPSLSLAGLVVLAALVALLAVALLRWGGPVQARSACPSAGSSRDSHGRGGARLKSEG